MMQGKKLTIFLITGVLVIGFVFFWIFNNPPQPKTEGIVIENEPQQQEAIESPNITNKKSLDLSGQGLEKLPAYVLSRTDLEELNISNNQITGALPSEIGKLTKLKTLNASNNLMTGVPAEIGHLPNLEILDLSNNQLTGLPYELGQLKKLRVLNLSGNSYSEQDLDVIREGLPSDVNIIL